MAEKEYIERGAFLKKCAEAWGHYGVTIKAIEGIADECAAADVVEVRHGKWILNEAWDVRTVDTLICSNCGKSFRYDVAIDYPYCPICITKMDGEREEQT